MVLYSRHLLSIPEKEQYQVGAEIIGGDLREVVDTANLLMEAVEVKGI